MFLIRLRSCLFCDFFQNISNIESVSLSFLFGFGFVVLFFILVFGDLFLEFGCSSEHIEQKVASLSVFVAFASSSRLTLLQNIMWIQLRIFTSLYARPYTHIHIHVYECRHVGMHMQVRTRHSQDCVYGRVGRMYISIHA